AVGRHSVYPAGSAADVAPDRLALFFTRTADGRYRARPELREAVTFAAHNVLSDVPFSHMDLVACRNLLVYLGPEAGPTALAVVHYALEAGGHLLLGPSEAPAGSGDLFAPVVERAGIYRRVGPPGPPPEALAAVLPPGQGDTSVPGLAPHVSPARLLGRAL